MFRIFRKKPPKEALLPSNMARPVLHLNRHEFVSLQWLMSGLLIAGMTGSSKSTSSAKRTARALVRLGCGGLVLSVKSECGMWVQLCKEEGRLDDLVIFNEQNPWRFDPIEFESTRTGRGGRCTESIVQILQTLVDFTSRDRNTGGRENEAYWRVSVMRLLRCATDLLLFAGKPVTVRGLYQLIVSAAQNLDEAASQRWQQSSFCYGCLGGADNRVKGESERADLEIVADYFLREMPALNEKTRSITVSQVTGTCDVLLRGALRNLFASGTNITPEAIEHGKIILVDMPYKVMGPTALFANLLWKTAFQRSIERRDTKVSTRPVFMFADEGHYYLHRDDALFQTTCRSARCASILVTQNIANLDAALGSGDSGRSEAESLLANFGTLIFHCNTCQRTNDFASKLIGESRVMMASGNTSYEGQCPWSPALSMFGPNANVSSGFSEQYRPIVEPSSFCRLRAGGKVNGWEADAIVIKSGDLFRSTGTTWLPVTFRQDL